MSAMIERLALAYSDGSYGILAEGTNVEKAFEEAACTDHNEHDASHFTRVAKIRFAIIEDLGAATKTVSDACPACGQPRQKASS